MLGEILEIKNYNLIVKKSSNVSDDIMNLYVKITDKDKIFVGEIVALNKETFEIKLNGEIVDGKFIYGITRKPSFSSQIELLSMDLI